MVGEAARHASERKFSFSRYKTGHRWPGKQVRLFPVAIFGGSEF
jgi:hypothetical protein